jgi:hypothetical protein
MSRLNFPIKASKAKLLKTEEKIQSLMTATSLLLIAILRLWEDALRWS